MRRYNGEVIDPSVIAATVEDLGEPRYRVGQIYQAVTRGLVTDFSEMTSLPAGLRGELAKRLAVRSLTEVATREAPRGASCKTLFSAADGSPVEAVLMLSRSRATVCVSSQVGCAVRCAFCASGQLGLRRSLSAEEMVDQVLHFARLMRGVDRRVTNVVVMGMGEPFHNYDETLHACRLLNDPEGFALGARAVSVSTAGVVPGIERFADEPEQFNLAVSLHAATDELRDRLVPLNRTYPLAVLLTACDRYAKKKGRRVMIEYVLLPGVNDGDEQVRELARRLRSPLYHVNLIPYNDTSADFRCPTAAEVASFRERLRAAGVSCTVRRSLGGEIEAACGQLALRSARGKPAS